MQTMYMYSSLSLSIVYSWNKIKLIDVDYLLQIEILTFSNVTLKTAVEVTEVFQASPKTKRRPTNVESSVLQRLLVERNQSFWHRLNTLVRTTVVTASSQTLTTEQLLVQTQVKLQAASRTIKQANEMAYHVLSKCKDILTSNFLPDVTICTL